MAAPEPRKPLPDPRIIRTEPFVFKAAKARAIADFERAWLSDLFARTAGNVSLAARLSHKDRSALNRMARKYGLAGHQFRQPFELGGRTLSHRLCERPKQPQRSVRSPFRQ